MNTFILTDFLNDYELPFRADSVFKAFERIKESGQVLGEKLASDAETNTTIVLENVICKFTNLKLEYTAARHPNAKPTVLRISGNISLINQSPEQETLIFKSLNDGTLRPRLRALVKKETEEYVLKEIITWDLKPNHNANS